MSDNPPGQKYTGATFHRDHHTVDATESTATIRYLQQLLSRRDHTAFLAVFEQPGMHRIARHSDYLRALAGEGLCLLLQSAKPPMALANRYGALLRDGLILAPAVTIEQLAKRLKSKDLASLVEHAERHTTAKAKLGKKASTTCSPAPVAPMLQVRRVAQIMNMLVSDGVTSAANGVLRSVFRSPQERTFLRALSLRFPGLLALPNYPLDQVADLHRLVGQLESPTLRYGQRCRLDAILVVPDEGDAVAAFELDSREHDRREVQVRDTMKNKLLGVIGLPFFRLRVESPESMTTDEWYALLTDEVLPYIDLGRRIQCRKAAYRLIPC